MYVMLLLIRLILAAVFAVAGVAKLLDRAGSRQSMREFGMLKNDDLQIRDLPKVAFVSGADGVTKVQAGDPDEEIREWNDAAGLPGVSIDLRRKLSHLLRKWFDKDRSENRVQVVSTALGQL
jgi:hypothetical protein